MNNALATAPQDACTDLAAPLSFTVPLPDLGEFMTLPEKRRNEVQATLRVLASIHTRIQSGSSLEAACQVVAAGHAGLRGCSKQSMRRKYDALVAGGWRALVAGYKGPKCLPPEFTSYVKALAEDNHRSMAEAWELLRTEIWPSGRPVPGYGSWSEWYLATWPDRPLPKVCPRRVFPDGWSERNLYRHAPSKGARVLFQRGLAAAKKHFPSVKRDPSGLRPFEVLVIDDFVLDCYCVFPGSAEHKPQIRRVAGLLAMDVGTRKKLKWGIGQCLERVETAPDGTTRTVRTGIARVDVQNLLHALFAEYGLPDYQVTIICENAAAAIAPELELALTTLFEGRVKIERTGLIDHKTLSNGFTERGGCPWEKGWIESAFNLLWNKLGSMPGYKGSNERLNGPADLDAKIALTKVLIGQGERALNLPPEKIMLLRLPFPSPQAVEMAFAWAIAAVDARTDHKYLGFGGVTEFLLRDGEAPRPFSELALLPPEAQAQVQVVERMESSLERWSRLGSGVTFTALPPAVLALLLLTPKRGFTYVDEAGTVLRGAADGTEYLGFFDPAAPEQLHLADLKGAYVGTLNRLGGRRGMVDLRDKAALAEAGGVARKIVNRTMAEIRARHADQDAQLAQDRAHNATVVADHKTETASLTTGEKIAQAAGAAAAEAHEMGRLDQSDLLAARAARAPETPADPNFL